MNNLRRNLHFLCLLTSTCLATGSAWANQQPAKLFASLPDICPTPDAFDIAPNGSLTLSCVNFADKNSKGELLSISTDGKVTHLATVPRLKEKRKANPMGIAYGPDGALYVADARGIKKGRILKLTFGENKRVKTEVIATGVNPNGLRYHNGGIYITQLKMPNVKSKLNTSGIYRFNVTDRNIKVQNTLNDKQLIFTTTTKNPTVQFGLDGLAFDSDGNLFTANLGDGIVYKLLIDNKGNVQSAETYAHVPSTARPDGMALDKNGNLYLAGFANNQIFKIDQNKKVSMIADYPDNDGSNGQLDQPADLIVYGSKLIISNFDLMKGKGIRNTKHDKPYTLSSIDLNQIN
jgi:sugar lactone lactonase YvrE